MAFVYAYFFSDFLCFDMSLLLLTVTLRGVSNKHCLLSFFSFKDKSSYKIVYVNSNKNDFKASMVDFGMFQPSREVEKFVHFVCWTYYEPCSQDVG